MPIFIIANFNFNVNVRYNKSMMNDTKQCNSCGNVSPNSNCEYKKDNLFTKSVIQIDNPENLVLFKKVVMPASLGDETTNPPYPGKYCNVLMVYEANGHSYLYSSDGIPTALGFDNGGILVVDEFPELDQAAINSLYIKRDTGDAKITTDGENWLIINEPGGKVLLVEEFPPVADARAQTLYILSDNGEARILDTDSTWLPLNTGGGGGGTVYFNNIMNRPKVDGVEMTSDTDIPISSLSSQINSLSSTLSSKLDKYVVTDLNADTNPSTTEMKLRASRENLWTEMTDTKTIPLPVASHTQAGIMNSATFNAVEQNKTNIEAIMGGAVAINGLPDPATQQDITDAWKNATGQTDLINHASVYDVTNNKVWTYYSNSDTWYPASNSAQVNVNTFTNTTEGTILGSTNDGQVFAEPDGTGSVNGWDTLSAQVSDNKDNIEAIQTAVDGKQDKLTAGNAITIEDDGTTSAWIYPERFFLDPDVKEGEGEVFSIDGTAHLKISDIKLYGKTSQSQYDGDNLLNMPYDMSREGGLNLMYSQEARGRVYFGNGQTALNGTPQKLFLYKRATSSYAMPTVPAGNYVTMSAIIGYSPAYPEVVIKASGVEYRTDRSRQYILSIPTSITIDEIYWEYTASQTGKPEFSNIPCLIPESQFSGYEPFTNLEPAPSPDYPQRVMTVTGNQEIRGAGSNLYNYEDAVVVTSGVTTDAEGYITFTYDGTQTSRYKNYWTNNLGLKPATTYRLVVEILSVSGAENFENIHLASVGEQSQISNSAILTKDRMVPGGVYAYDITTTSDFSKAIYGIRTFANAPIGAVCAITIRISVVEDASMTPAKFKYQPYIGQTTQLNLGKNIFDKDTVTYLNGCYFEDRDTIKTTTNGRDIVLYIPCDPYVSYCFSDQSGINMHTRKISTVEDFPSVGVQTSRSHYVSNSLGAVTYTTPIRSKYIVINYRSHSGVDITTKIPEIVNTLQIERSQTITPYASYFEPIELCKLGSAQDIISKDGLNWKLRKEIAKLTYDGTETDWVFNATNNSVSIPHNGYIVPGDHLCTHFQVGDATSTNNTFSIDATSITFKSNEVITSLQDWKDWLAENKLEVYAKLATPTDTQITQPEVLTGLVGARNIITYPDQTNFSVGAQEDLPAYLWVEAYLNSLEGVTKAIRDIPICC